MPVPHIVPLPGTQHVPAPPAIRLAIARNKSAKARAAAAIRWMAGCAVIPPTAGNAAQVFNISRSYLRTAQGNGSNKPAPKADPLARAWAHASAEQRAKFVTDNMTLLWSAIDGAPTPITVNGHVTA
jgi:hypothetical protein